jgi:hypothetical protein
MLKGSDLDQEGQTLGLAVRDKRAVSKSLGGLQSHDDTTRMEMAITWMAACSRA